MGNERNHAPIVPLNNVIVCCLAAVVRFPVGLKRSHDVVMKTPVRIEFVVTGPNVIATEHAESLNDMSLIIQDIKRSTHNRGSVCNIFRLDSCDSVLTSEICR